MSLSVAGARRDNGNPASPDLSYIWVDLAVWVTQEGAPLHSVAGAASGQKRRAIRAEMTVSYQYEVASSTSGGFTRLLFMWRGSLYKLIYRELILFIGSFGVLSALYRHAFNDGQKRYVSSHAHVCSHQDTANRETFCGLSNF